MLAVKGKTVGTVVVDGDDLFTANKNMRARFVVKAEAHVMLRLKRVFERIWKGSHGKASLDASPANARELLWFMERYPLETDRRTAATLKRLAEQDVNRERMISEILSGKTQGRMFDLALPPRDYQRVVGDLCTSSGSLLCADELGLGKTISAFCVLAAEGALPALVVCPTHLQTQWRDQLARFMPGVKTHIAKKGVPYDFSKVRGLGGDPDVLIMSYAKLSGWADALAGKIKTFVADEAHEFRHSGTLKYVGGAHIAHASRFRLGLTATPIFGMGAEIFHVMDVLAPGRLGAWEEFQREWCHGEIITETVAFNAFLREQGLMLRRTRKEVGRELPALQVIPHPIEADLAALDREEKSCADLARIILSSGASFDKMKAAGELDWRLRRATGVAKAPFVGAFAQMLLESEDKLVIWAWHHEVHDILASHLRNHNPVMYTGRETPKQKDESKRRFVEDKDCRVMIMSLRSGSGLDGVQHVCSTGLIAEMDWAPAVHEQCAGRLDRDGQTRPTAVYIPVADSGSDPIIADVLGLKTQQADGIVRGRQGDDEILETKVDPQHMQRLARSLLERHGLPIPIPETDLQETA